MISGSSVATASPIASVLRAIPGPELDVTPRDPAYDAPIAAQAAAISSSAWKVTTPSSFMRASMCSRGEAGVIGYEANTMRASPDDLRPDTRPHARASVPLTVR